MKFSEQENEMRIFFRKYPRAIQKSEELSYVLGKLIVKYVSAAVPHMYSKINPGFTGTFLRSNFSC